MYEPPLQHGLHEIVVVEGADRIGGRVKDVQFGGITVELGANWIHYSDIGEDEVNPVEELVRATRLNTVEDNYDDLIFRYRGIYISTSIYRYSIISHYLISINFQARTSLRSTTR